jgi:hypothetical protein
MSESSGPPAVIVTLNIVPALEERIVDWLLARDEGGFTSRAAHGHSSHHDLLSAAEQVSGRQRRLEFEVELPADALDRFIAELSEAFTNADLYYTAVPVLRSGHLGEQEELQQRGRAAAASGDEVP